MCTVSVAMLCLCCRWLRYLLLLISRARGGEKKSWELFYTHVCGDGHAWISHFLAENDDRGGAKTRRKCGSLRDLSPFPILRKKGFGFFFWFGRYFPSTCLFVKPSVGRIFPYHGAKETPFSLAVFSSFARGEEEAFFLPSPPPAGDKRGFFQSRFLRP